jgi:urease accessory protein
MSAALLDAARVGRDGTLRLRFERRNAVSVVAGCRYTLPLQVLAPLALADPAAIVSILNPTGGLVGGDRLAIDVHAASGSHAVLTTPSATRVYRAAGDGTEQTIRLTLGPGAVVEWVPDHTIPSAGAVFRQTIDVDIDETATLILIDAFAAGRIARGEAWRFTRLDGALSIHDRQGVFLHDRFVLHGSGAGAGAEWDGLGLAEAHPYFASMAVVGAFDLERFVADVGRLDTPAGPARVAGGALSRRGVLVRCLATSAPALGETLEACWALARRALLGLRPLTLRKN